MPVANSRPVKNENIVVIIIISPAMGINRKKAVITEILAK